MEMAISDRSSPGKARLQERLYEFLFPGIGSKSQMGTIGDQALNNELYEEGTMKNGLSGQDLFDEITSPEVIWQETLDDIRRRVRDPNEFQPDTFVSSELTGIPGVWVVQAKLLKENVPDDGDKEALVIQAYHFERRTKENRDGWIMYRAKEWMGGNNPYGDYYADRNESDDDGLTEKADLNMQCHTSFPVDIELKETADADGNQTGDKQFSYVLCHEGPNTNGVFFSEAELTSHHKTIIGKKVNLQHSQKIADIVGNITSSKLAQSAGVMRVEGMGKLFCGSFEKARQSHKLLKEGIIKQVSMECSYRQGECSVCGKKARSASEYCIHLSNFRGRQFDNQMVYEILHGVTFTGLGLLDRKGADKDAVISTVGHHQKDNERINNANGGKQVAEAGENKKDETANAEGHSQEIATLKEENNTLKNELAALKKEVGDFKEKELLATRTSRSSELVEKLIVAGMEFKPEAKTTEITRLAAMDDGLFDSAKITYEMFIARAGKKEKPETKSDEGGKAKAEDEEPGKPQLKADAGVDHLNVPDSKTDLISELTAGFACMDESEQKK